MQALKIFDGAMVGRAAYEHPLLWQTMDEIIYGEQPRSVKASEINKGVLPHAEKHLQSNGRLWDISRHLLKIVEGVPGARSWRKDLTLNAQKAEADLTVLEKAAQQLLDVGL